MKNELSSALLTLAAFTIFLSPARSNELRYQAVWKSGKEPSLHTAPLDRAHFLKSGQTLAGQGWRLIDVETAVLNGRRVYAGLFKKGTGANLFEGPIGPIEMREAMEKRRTQGLRLKDFEVFATGDGGRRYLGVWVPGSGEEVLTGPMQEAAFFARGEQEVKAGKRLIDVELTIDKGVLLYHGLFRTGTGGNMLTAPMSEDAFARKRDEMVAKGLELMDFERVTIGETEKFAGVFSPGRGESQLSTPRAFGPFFTFAQAQFNAGKTTEEFELISIPSKPTPPGGRHKPPRGGVDTTDLPNNPRNITLTKTARLVIEWTHDTDNLFKMELPEAWLPKWLPHKNGVAVLPDEFCSLNIRKAGSIVWQTFDNHAIQTPPFLLTRSVEALGSERFLGGIRFSGPFGACRGTQTAFQFNFPFTTGEGIFEPQENMKLVVEGFGDTRIDFIKGSNPEVELTSAFELFEDHTREKLQRILEAFAEVFGGSEDLEDYCLTVGNYWREVCSLNPAACPVPPDMPDCTP